MRFISIFILVFSLFLAVSCQDKASDKKNSTDSDNVLKADSNEIDGDSDGTLSDDDSTTEDSDYRYDSDVVWSCFTKKGDEIDFLPQLGCEDDFQNLASEPMDSSIPGARSGKTVLDRIDGNLYFQNSKKYQIHWEFARAHLSGGDKPFVDELGPFNEVEYYSPDRRFILGAITKYEGPNVWVWELSPYDTASAEMITESFRKIRDNSFIGGNLYFHPTSEAIEKVAKTLPADIRIITTKELFEGIDYQPLNLGTSYGKLRFVKSAELASAYVNFRDIVVLDKVPNDISVVSGIITAEFQTPLSHINVLSQNRKTPNMAFSKALEDEKLKSLDGKWVKLSVGAFEWNVAETTKAEADKWWDSHKPETVQIPSKDLETKGLIDIDKLLDKSLPQKERIKKAIPAAGGKASHYAELYTVKNISVPKAFVIPIYYYDQFLKSNGIDKKIETLLADPKFQEDAKTRDEKLAELRTLIETGVIDATFLSEVKSKIKNEFAGIKMRFRSSTNAEDLDGFTGAGLYVSKTGDINDPNKSVEEAIRKVWASVWYFRAFEERSYRGISHKEVGMSLLVHRSFPAEYANGVALTSNPFDTSGLEPAFYINVQLGDLSVVLPDPGVTTDQIIYQYDMPGSPIIYLQHSNQVAEGKTVLTDEQIHILGAALKEIHTHFFESYGPTEENPYYAMDVEFKFDNDDKGNLGLVIKQARPHSGRGTE